MNQNIPKDPVMLLSFVNTQLRDFYPSLDECCAALGIEETELAENWLPSTIFMTAKRISSNKRCFDFQEELSHVHLR